MGFLASQPKRSWGEDDFTTTTGHRNSEKDGGEFYLDENEWPPTPPKSKKARTIAGASASTVSTNVKVPAPSIFDKGKGKEPGLNLARLQTSSQFGPNGRVTSASATTNSSRGSVLEPTTSMKARTTSASSYTFANRPGASVNKAPITTRTEAPIFAKKASAAPVFGSASSSSATLKSMPWAPKPTNPSVLSLSSATTEPAKKRVMPWDSILNDNIAGPSKPISNYHRLDGSMSSGKAPLLTSSAIDIKQKVMLSSEQQMVLNMVLQGKNVFFTGSAGTGKSVLLREIITSLKRKHKGSADAVAVTASTGMAACNVGGITIHSFSGIGLGIESAEVLVGKIRKNRNASGRWQRVKVLVIDEVSMVDGFLFDKLAKIASIMKAKSKTSAAHQPFGGIQLVVTGDFFQLPPVVKGSSEPSFAFDAQNWSKVIDHTVLLTQVFRQKDTTFIDMLNELRLGTASDQTIAAFRRLKEERNYTDGMEPTELFSLRHEVQRANQTRLDNLPGEENVFFSDDWPTSPEERQKNAYLKNFMACDKLVLKEDAQVMLIKNLTDELVNGTVGKVFGFGTMEEFHRRFDEDLSDHEAGASDAVLARQKAEKRPSNMKAKVPWVRWRVGSSVVERPMEREDFVVEDTKGQKVASRKQFPLILAWAMSIHKSQGQTLPRVKVDLNKVFERGQAYVALSRATSLDGLQVLNFDKSKVKVHNRVVQWAQQLEVLDAN